jgi:hypothetical protein
MFKVIVLAVAFAVVAEPAAYKVTTTDAAVVVKVEGKTVEPGKVYEVPPFVGTKELSYELTWSEKGESRTAKGTFEVTAGYLTVIDFSAPREFVAHRPKSD